MKDKFYSDLLKIRHTSAKIAPKIEHIIRGSIVRVARSCGKPSCRCRTGPKHRAIYISKSYRGRTRMIYIPPKSQKDAIKLVQNYQRLKVVIDRVSECNIALLTTVKGPKTKKNAK